MIRKLLLACCLCGLLSNFAYADQPADAQAAGTAALNAGVSCGFAREDTAFFDRKWAYREKDVMQALKAAVQNLPDYTYSLDYQAGVAAESLGNNALSAGDAHWSSAETDLNTAFANYDIAEGLMALQSYNAAETDYDNATADFEAAEAEFDNAELDYADAFTYYEEAVEHYYDAIISLGLGENAENIALQAQDDAYAEYSANTMTLGDDADSAEQTASSVYGAALDYQESCWQYNGYETDINYRSGMLCLVGGNRNHCDGEYLYEVGQSTESVADIYYGLADIYIMDEDWEEAYCNSVMALAYYIAASDLYDAAFNIFCDAYVDYSDAEEDFMAALDELENQ